MNPTNTPDYLFLMANLYHQIALTLQPWIPALSQFYEAMSQRLFDFLHVAGLYL